VDDVALLQEMTEMVTMMTVTFEIRREEAASIGLDK